MNDYEKIISKLEEHKEHATKFREELKVGLNTVAIKIEDLTTHQKIANGRTGKLEETVNNLRIEDVLMNEKLKTMKIGSKMISDRTWAVITSVVSVLTVSIIMWVINK